MCDSLLFYHTMKVVIACGGTGGHLFPGIAVAEELTAMGHEVLLIISEKKVDAEACAKYEHLKFEVVDAIAKPKLLSLRMVTFLLKLRKSISKCRSLLKREKADVVLGMGGFTSFAPVYAGHRLGLRTFVHDSNAVPGKTNIMIAKYCSTVLLGLKAAERFFPNSRTAVVGTPVRGELRSLPDRQVAAAKWGFKAELPTLLVFGGSQGAQGLNGLVVEASQKLTCQILHVTGQADYERISEMVGQNDRYHTLAFCDDMAAAYAVADGCVCRSGASSLTELAFLGIPSVLIPYPYAADDHQTANAEVFTKEGAALMAQESELKDGGLVDLIEQILPGSSDYEPLATRMKAMGTGDAAKAIAALVKG